MTDSSPNDVQLDEACREMALNALSHVEDAEVLIRQGRWRGAFALATLSMEEVGKAWAIQDEPPGHPQRRMASFNRVKRDHAAKLEQARQFAAWLDQLVVRPRYEDGKRMIDIEAIFDEGHQYMAENDHDMRLSGTYVDILDGLAIGGVGAVTEQQARDQLILGGFLAHSMAGYLAASVQTTD